MRDASPLHVGGYGAGAPRGLGLLLAVLGVFSPFVGQAAQAAAAERATEPVITERGPHHRVWTFPSEPARPDAMPPLPRGYVEVATGMH